MIARSKDLFERALEGGKQLTRTAMYEVLEAGGISTASQRGLHILSRLVQDGLICFGARAGKQQTFALLDEWAPMAKRMARDEALAELARHFISAPVEGDFCRAKSTPPGVVPCKKPLNRTNQDWHRCHDLASWSFTVAATTHRRCF
jgi:hypothetical protein